MSLSTVGRFRWVILPLTGVLLLGCSAEGNQGNDERESIAIGNVAVSLSNALLMSAFVHDPWSQEGLEWESTDFGGSSSTAVAGVLSGDVDVTSVGHTAAMDAMREGADIVVVAASARPAPAEIGLRADLAEELGINEDSPMEARIQALKGLTIGAPPPGSVNDQILRAVLAEYGVDPDEDVQIIPTETTALVEGLRSGTFDAVAWGIGVLAHNYADGSAIQLVSYPEGDADFLSEFIYGTHIARADRVEENPELFERYFAGLKAIGEEYRQNPEAVRDGLRAEYYSDLDEQIFKTGWEQSEPSFVPEWQMTREAWDETNRMFGEWTGNDYSSLDFATYVAPWVQE